MGARERRTQYLRVIGRIGPRAARRAVFEPFLAYQATKTWTFTLQSESTADWEADTHTWTIPINFEVAKLSTLGHFPCSYQFGVGGFPAHPEDGPSWKIRAAVIILLPKAH